MTDLPRDYARCQGATAVLMGTRTLASSCVDCLRRTSSRTHERIWFINPPTKFPCQQKLTRADMEVYQ